MEQKLTYTEACNELKDLVSSIESSDVAIDELETKLKRAAMLLEICKTKLKEVEDTSEQIITKLENISK